MEEAVKVFCSGPGIRDSQKKEIYICIYRYNKNKKGYWNRKRMGGSNRARKKIKRKLKLKYGRSLNGRKSD